MAKVTIKKELMDKPVDLYGDLRFLPRYNLYVGDKMVGRYYNIYEAAREAERQMDLGELEMAYEENPQAFSSITPQSLSNFNKE
jgi:hypothetical protein